jgi:UDP-N-acetylglucosamine transferase subunit ALG13
MILVTCGTNEQPFDRLVAASRELARDEALVVQYGSSLVEHGDGEWLDFVPFEVLADLMAQARIVISHAGVGSIMLARRCGKLPVVVPRRLHLDEAVDDHQLSLARRLDDTGVVRLVEDETQLRTIVRAPFARAGVRPARDLPGAEALAADLNDALGKLVVPLAGDRLRRPGRPRDVSR